MTTEEQIAKIAQNFGQGLQNFQAGKRANEAKALQAEATRRQQALQSIDAAAKLTAASGKSVTPDIANSYLSGAPSINETLSSLPESPKAIAAREDRAIDNRYKESKTTKNNRGAGGAAGLSVAEKEVDKAFGKEYQSFVVNGGFSKAQNSLKQLKEVANQLGNGKENLSGGLLGRTPDIIAGITNPGAIEAREKVGTVIQDSLRQILGSAYTQVEGENVIRRAYDPRLPEAANKKKLDALVTQLEKAAAAKVAASQYFEQNGTMKGFKGTVVNNVNDIFNESDAIADTGSGQQGRITDSLPSGKPMPKTIAGVPTQDVTKMSDAEIMNLRNQLAAKKAQMGGSPASRTGNR